jgi:hypothetical protein
MKTETYHSLQRKFEAARGFFLLPGKHSPPKGFDHVGDPVRIHPEWDRGVRGMIEACESAGVPVLFRFAPLPAQWKHVRDFAPLERWIDDLESSHGRPFFVRPIIEWYEPEICWDTLHLNARGVERFTTEVAKDVQAALEK